MSSTPRLVIVIPADARPQQPVDWQGMCAPPGVRAPAHLRARFARPAAPPPAPAPVPVEAAPLLSAPVITVALSSDLPSAPSPSPADAALASAVTEPITEPLEEPVEAPVEELVAAHAAAPLAPPLESGEYEEDAGSEVEPSALPEVHEAEPPAPEPTEPRELAESVSRFVEEEEAAAYEASAPVAAAPFPEDEVESLSGGPLQGFGTLIAAILTLVLLASGALYVYQESLTRPEDEPIASGQPLFPKIGVTPNEGDPPAEPPSEPPSPPSEGGQPGEAPPSEGPVDKPPSEPPPTDEGPEVAKSEGPSLGFGEVLVGVDSNPAPATGFDFGVEVGVEEDEPGLIRRIEGLRAQAVAAEKAGRNKEALQLYAALLDIKPGDKDALFRSGTIHYKQGTYDEAESFYARVLEVDPESTRARNNFGLVLLARGQRDAARKAFEEAARGNDPDAHTNLGHELAREGKALAAAESYRRALAIDPEHGEARYGLALALLEDDESSARGHFQALAEREGVGPRAQMMLGKMAYDEGDVSEAVELYKAALDRDSSLITARMNYAMALIKLERGEEAVQQMRLVVAERPKDAIAWTNMGIALMAVGDRKRAKQCYEYALNLDGALAVTHFNYARCAESFQNYLIALEEYEAALRLDPFYWQAAYNIGLIYARGQKWEKALESLDQAISIKGGHPSAHLERGRALFQLRRWDEAVSALETYLRIAPDSDPNKAKVAEILEGWKARQREAETTGSPF